MHKLVKQNFGAHTCNNISDMEIALLAGTKLVRQKCSLITFIFMQALSVTGMHGGLLVSQCTWLSVKSSGVELRLGTLCCVLEQDTYHSQCLSTQLYKWEVANLMLKSLSSHVYSFFFQKVKPSVVSNNIFISHFLRNPSVSFQQFWTC